MTGKSKLLSSLAAALLVAGCSGIPNQSERTSLADMRETAVSGWETTPGLVYRTHEQSARLMTPEGLPDQLYEKPLHLVLGERANVEDLSNIIQAAGVPVMLATDELGEASVYVPAFDGPIGIFLDSLATASNLSFTWNNGVLIIDKDRPYLLRIPQNEDIAKVISSSLESMGASEVQASKEAGLVSFRAASRNKARIEAYLDRLSVNTSMVNLQVAVMNVSLNEERRRGLDWSSLGIQAGDMGLLQSGSSAAGAMVDAAGDAAESAAEAVTGQALELAGGGVSMVMESSNVSLKAVLNMLSTYGDTRTSQNLTLKTLSGVPVKLNKGEEIPYVDDMSLNVNENSSTSGIETTTVDTGFKIEINPYYDAEDNLVTVDLDLDIKSLVGFRELSAGNQLGTVSRPQIQKQQIENIARMKAGETALIGGLVYESISDNRTSLAGLEDLPMGSKNLKTSHNALFVLMRPTVVVYGPRPVSKEEGK